MLWQGCRKVGGKDLAKEQEESHKIADREYAEAIALERKGERAKCREQ